MTLAEAAEVGTHKVIGEHSTIGLVVTTDGSFSDIPRENYAPAEKRVIEELSALGKPFLVLVNSAEPGGEAAQAVCEELHTQYGIEPVAVNCIDLDEDGITDILQRVLYEFPVCEIGFILPRYIGSLPAQHPVQASIYQCIRAAASGGDRAETSPREISADPLFLGTPGGGFFEEVTLDLVVTPAGGKTSLTGWSSVSSSSGKARRRSALRVGEVSPAPSPVAFDLSYSSSSESS